MAHPDTLREQVLEDLAPKLNAPTVAEVAKTYDLPITTVHNWLRKEKERLEKQPEASA